MPTTNVFDITDPYTGLRWTFALSFALGTGAAFAVGGAEFWPTLLVGFLFGLILLFPVTFIMLGVAWVTMLIGSGVRWYLAERPSLSVKAMRSHQSLVLAILMLCLWAGLAILMWDAEAVFVSVVAAFLATCILGLPVAFVAGLLWRYAELTGDAVAWVRDRRRYRRAP